MNQTRGKPLTLNLSMSDAPQDSTPSKNLHGDLWQKVSKDLREELGSATFDLWLSKFWIKEILHTEVVLMAPGSMYAIWVEENFENAILDSLRKHIPNCSGVCFEVVSTTPNQSPADFEKEETFVDPLVDVSTPTASSSSKKRAVHETIDEDELLKRGRSAGLVEIHRFENFVVGDNSQLASAAAKAVSEKPGSTYQPLFFHSACGLGKTHLLHAIGWESLRLRPKSKIIFVTAEKFANDYIDAIQKNNLSKFRNKYRKADLLLIDDVQFLGRKEGLQREFFHTFNSLSDSRKQIVLASDCPASEINELEDRLVSRFQWGLSVELHRPGFETRAAILRRKRDDWAMDVSDDLINLIVERVQGNVRLLEGALIRVAMVAAMSDSTLTIPELEETLADIAGNEEISQVGVREVQEAVAEHYDLEPEILRGKKRTARVAEARQVAMYLSRELTELSLVEIASGFGKDHGTVIYAVKKIKSRLSSSNSLRSSVELIRRRLVRDRAGSGAARQGASRASGASLRKSTEPQFGDDLRFSSDSETLA